MAAAEQVETGVNEGGEPQIVYSWTAHPARRDPVRGLLGAVMVAAVAFAVFLSTGSSGWTVGSVAILILALNRFFFASRFELTEDGIIARYPLRRMRAKWRDLRRFLTDQFGGYLSTRSRRSFLDRYRGIHLLFDEENRAETVERIRGYMQQSGSSTMPGVSA